MSLQEQALYDVLAAEARILMSKSPYINLISIEPDADLIPVPRSFLEGVADGFQIAAAKIKLLERMTVDLAEITRNLLRDAPSHPNVTHALEVLQQVTDKLK